MAKQLYANNAKGRLNAGINNVVTSLTLQGGQGALFPNPTNGEYFLATLVDSSGNREIVKVTQRTGDVFNVMVRAQEGTASISFLANDKVENRPTAGTMQRLQQVMPVSTIAADDTLDEQDVWGRFVITAEADVELPDSTGLEVGDWIEFLSQTEQLVRLVRDGADTIDGETSYQLPSYCSVKAVVAGAGTWVLFGRSSVEVGDVVPSFRGSLKKGYCWPNGVDKHRTNQGGLFEVYGTTHGTGNGVDTFGIPNLQGRGMVGQETMGAGTTANARQKSTNLTTTTGLTAATVADATGLEKGMYIYAANVSAGTKISAINGVNVTLSAVATATNTSPGRFSFLAQDPQTIGSKGGHQNPLAHNHTGTASGSGSGQAEGDANFFGGGAGPAIAPDGAGVGDADLSVSVSVSVTITSDGLGDAGNLPPEIVGTMMIKT